MLVSSGKADNLVKFSQHVWHSFQGELCTGARFGREKKSILYQIWFLSPPGFQQHIGT